MSIFKSANIVVTLFIFSASTFACAQQPPETKPAPSAATSIAKSGDKQWDLYVLGDSILFGFIGKYADYLEQDLGIEVVFHDMISYGQQSQAMLNSLRNNQKLRQGLSRADVIVIHVPRDRFAVCPRYEASELYTCLPGAVQLYNTDVDAIFAELVSIRNPSEALIRTMDAYEHWSIPEANKTGVQNLLKDAWLQANNHLTMVAAQYRIPVAPVYVTFNGTDGEKDPVAAGLMNDKVHTNDQGAALLAELVRSLGYDYSAQP